MYCSPRIFSIEGWGVIVVLGWEGCCLFRGGGLLLFFKGRHCPPIPGIGNGDVRDLFFSLFLPLLLFRQVIGFELLDRFLKKFLRKFASFKPTLGQA